MRQVIVYVWMVVLTAYVVSAENDLFRMKHRSSGMYIDVYYDFLLAPSGTPIILRSSPSHQYSNWWKFEHVMDHWGYLYHFSSLKHMDVSTSDMNAVDGTTLVLDSNIHWSALFALNEAHNYIMHKSGRYIHPKSGTRQPNDPEQLWIWGGIHDGMKFQFVDNIDPQIEYPIYGAPTMVAKWSIINMVLNAIGTHVTTFTVKVGKSVSQSTTSSFQFKWEVKADSAIKAFSVSVSTSFQYMVEQTSTATWTEEITKSTKITVTPGSSVVTWQWMIDVSQYASKAVYQSNLLADTDSPTKKPNDLQFYKV